jgi:hypothetical protein
VKLDQFRTLCHSEWHSDLRGDVQALRLTGPSLAELTAEVLADPEQSVMPTILRITPEQAENMTAGASLTEIVNPVTKSTVRVNLAPDRDTAEVVLAHRVVVL